MEQIIIRGESILDPEAVAAKRGLTYTPEQLDRLVNTLPNEAEWQSLNELGYMLVPGPPEPKTILDILAMKDVTFKDNDLCQDEREEFLRTDRVRFGWLKVPRDIYLPKSFDRDWHYQKSMAGNPCFYYIPNVAEVAWAATTYQVVRGEHLLVDCWVRTSSESSTGGQVCLGFSLKPGWRVQSYPSNVPYKRVGLAIARK